VKKGRVNDITSAIEGQEIEGEQKKEMKGDGEQEEGTARKEKTTIDL